MAIVTFSSSKLSFLAHKLIKFNGICIIFCFPSEVYYADIVEFLKQKFPLAIGKKIEVHP